MKKYDIIIYCNSYIALTVRQNCYSWFRILKKEVKRDSGSLRLSV